MTEPKTQTERAKAIDKAKLLADLQERHEIAVESVAEESPIIAQYLEGQKYQLERLISDINFGCYDLEVEAATRGLREQLEEANELIEHYASNALYGHRYAGKDGIRNRAQEYLKKHEANL